MFGGFGSAKELAKRKGLAIVAESESSFCSMQRHPDGTPVRLGMALGDMASANAAYAAIVTALLARERTGMGRHLDIAMVKVLLALNSTAVTGEQMESHELRTAGYGIFPASDGYVAIGVNSDNLFGKLATLMGQSWMMADERYAHYVERDERAAEVNAIVKSWTSSRPARQVVDELTGVGVPGGVVATPRDVLDSDMVRELRYLIEVGDGLGGTVTVPGNPLGYEPAATTIPAPGEHTAVIADELLGLSADELEAQRLAGAFGVT